MKIKILGLLLVGAFTSCSNTQNNSDNTQQASTTEEVSNETVAAPEVKSECQREVQAKISIEWTEKVSNNAEKIHNAVIADNGLTKFTLTTDNTVSEFKILALQFVEADENGKMKFNTEEKFKLNQFSNKEQINVLGEMFGTIPNLGISYQEGDQTKEFAIVESGEDGSLSLMKINE